MMIIECVNCNKKFNVNSELIPNEGRTIQCGSCNHVWFFNKEDRYLAELIEQKQDNDVQKPVHQKKPITTSYKKEKKSDNFVKGNNNIEKHKGSEIVKYKPKSTFSFSKFLSFVLVGIISIISFLIIVDTFKSSLYIFFPNLEFFLFSLYETLKDIELFVKDLI
mgnify:CR=1 FL=1